MSAPTGLRRFTAVETREAVAVTRENLDEVATWCGGEVLRYATQPDLDHVVFEGHGRDQDAWPGDDVVVRDEGEHASIPAWLFERDMAPKWTEQRA